jgi:hypothetical protein
MEQENESAQEVVVEQEEQTAEETNNVTLSKAEFTKLQRKAIAYDVTKKQQPKEEIINRSITPRDILRSDEMKLSREGYSEDQIEFIMQNGGRKVLEDKNSLVTLAIQTAREQARAEDAANRTSGASQLSEVELKFTPEQLANIPTAELEKILPHA